MNNLPITPPPPRGGVVPEPNANATEFKPEIDRLMTVKECAEFCNVHRGRIGAAIEMKTIRVVSLGPRTVRIWFSDLKKWIDQNTVRPVSQRRLAQERALQSEYAWEKLQIVQPEDIGISMSRSRFPKS
jgi:excisionase family DNA binding protein